MTVKNIKDDANAKFQLMLDAAKAYYLDFDPIMEDHEYDDLTKKVSAVEKHITHHKKHLVDWESLKTCSSLYYIKRKDYG